MPLDVKPIREARSAAQYTGDNSADLNTEISDFTIVGEDANGLTFNSGGQQYTVQPSGYVAWYQGAVTEVFQNEDDLRSVYADLGAVEDHVHDLTLTTGPARAPQA